MTNGAAGGETGILTQQHAGRGLTFSGLTSGIALLVIAAVAHDGAGPVGRLLATSRWAGHRPWSATSHWLTPIPTQPLGCLGPTMNGSGRPGPSSSSTSVDSHCLPSGMPRGPRSCLHRLPDCPGRSPTQRRGPASGLLSWPRLGLATRGGQSAGPGRPAVAPRKRAISVGSSRLFLIWANVHGAVAIGGLVHHRPRVRGCVLVEDSLRPVTPTASGSPDRHWPECSGDPRDSPWTGPLDLRGDVHPALSTRMGSQEWAPAIGFERHRRAVAVGSSPGRVRPHWLASPPRMA